PVILARIVFRRPDAGPRIDLDRSIEHDRRRRVAVVERGSIDQRLEGGTRLPERLRRAIELALVVGKAAGHGEHATGLRLHDDHGARNLRYLVQSELIVLSGDGLDIDDVTRLQNL